MLRIGNGYDVHRLVQGRKLVLGGVDIPHSTGLDGHSDADALSHALCDAILGACGAGDIGHYFPDTDPQWKNVSSMVLLKKVGQVCAQRRFRIANADSIIVAQKPKLAPFMEQMRKNVAAALDIDVDRVNVKATTTERLGFAGREEGIAAYAVVLLEKIDS
ncbi:MAG: 2-C-methyl-D-erythritol 2,4-cyclodiphosphate synthase [Nitrospinae bacterium]|nr:2-C-methyl-D-erythritol 2,4-cyclodiphosphate synthase [Nitrospinota bacterium]